MKERVLLRARSGPKVGLGHVMRTRAVAEAVVQAGEALLVVDEPASAARLCAAGFEAVSVLDRPLWAHERASGAWIDGLEVDWTGELKALKKRGTPSYLVENRTAARLWADFIVQPKLYVDPDPWERLHGGRILRGASWIPLRAAVRAVRPARVRDLDLLVTFGGSDPLCSTERVLAALPPDLKVAVSVGAHMEARRAAIERAAAHLGAEVLAPLAELAPVMARARVALSALGTTLFELAYLRTPAMILANYEADRPVLDFYRAHGPFRPLGLASELGEQELANALARALATLRAPSATIEGLGDGATRLAERLLQRVPLAVAA